MVLVEIRDLDPFDDADLRIFRGKNITSFPKLAEGVIDGISCDAKSVPEGR